MADSIVSVLECCQTTTTSAAQQDLLAALTSVHNKCDDQRRFCDEYVALLRRCLAHGDKSPAVERVLDLTARFAGSLCANDKTLSATASNASGDMDSDEQQQQQDEVHPFFSQMVRVVLDSHNVSGSQLVRERSCRLLQHLLLHLGEDALLDDQLCEHIYQAMLQRLQDAAPAVRQHAVAALARLQTPSDRQCPVVAAFVFHLRCDPSADVRCAVLRHICGARHTLQPVFERARDVSAPVRRQTYCFLIKVHLKSLTIKQRRSVLRLGLNDRDASVRRTVATQLLPAWLRLLKCSVAKLLHHLYVETCADLAELVVKTACTDLSPTEMADMVGFGEAGAAGVTADRLSSEQALLWRVLLQCLREHGSAEAEAALERITPDLPAMCRLLEQVAEKVLSAAEDACPVGNNAGASSTTQTANVEADAAEAAAGRAFVLRQLLALTGALDLWDEFGRRQLVTLIQRLFSRCRQQQQQQQALSLLEPLMRLYERAVPDVAQRVSAVVDVISELLAPIDQQPDGERASQDVPASPDNAANDGGGGDDDNQSSRLRVERAQLRVQINELRDQLDAAVARQDFADAQQLQQRLAQLQLQQNRLDTQLDAPATGNAAADVRQLPERQLSSTQPENDDDKCVSVRQDAATRLTCLELLWQLLQSANVSRLSDQLRQLTDELVLPCVQSEQPAVRRVAVTALSTMCLLSASLARQHLVLLVQVCQADETEIQLAAFRGVFDQLLVHGPRQLLSAAQPSADEQQQDQLTVIMAQLTQLLDVTDNEARGVGVEGLCRLLMHGRVRSPRLLERLVLLWYSPLSDDDAPVRNMLGVFLPAFASAARCNQQLLAEAMLPTLLTLIQAPLASPLVEVDIDDVARFFVQLTRECMLDSGKPTATSIATGDQHSDASVHEWLAFRLITALLDERRCRADAARRPLARALCQLQLHTMSQTSAEQLRQLLDRLTSGDTTAAAAAGGDKTVRRCLDKLAMTVCALCDTVNTTGVTSSPPPPPPPEQQQEEEEDGEEEMVFEQQTTESPPGPHCVVEQMADGEVHLCSDVADKRNANTPPAREVKALRSTRPSAANVRHSAIMSAGVVAESDEEDDDVISTTTTTSSPCSSLAGDNSRAGTRKSSRQATRHKTAAPQANTTKSRRNARR